MICSKVTVIYPDGADFSHVWRSIKEGLLQIGLTHLVCFFLITHHLTKTKEPTDKVVATRKKECL